MSTFENRDQFINAAASEKVTLATVEARKRLYVWTDVGAGLFSKVVPNFVCGVKQNDSDISQVNTLTDVIPGTWFYDVPNSTLYVNFTGGLPNETEVIVTYKLFYASKGVQTTHDLVNISEEVHWEGRIQSSPGYKHKIGIDQSLTSLVGEGTLSLFNQDGGLDNIFDDYIFENQNVVIYSWNTDLEPNQSKVIYRGRVTNKSYDGNLVKFKIKDQTFALLDSPLIQPFTNADNVSESVKGQYKRRVYGRVDGLRGQSIDQIADGIALTGTVSMQANSNVLTGSGTSFLNEVVQGDKLIIGTQEFDVESVDSNTQLTMSDEAQFSFGGQIALSQPERGSVLRNRTFLGAGHICAKVTHTVTNALQFNRVQLDSTDGLFSGDFIEFDFTGERIEIKNIAPNNIVVLQQNVLTKPAAGSLAIRQPVQEVYVGSRRVNSDDFTVFNNSTGCGIVFDDDVEFNLSTVRNSPLSGTFTNGSREVAVSSSEVDLNDVFQAGDWVKPDNISYSTFYKITHVTSSSLFLSQSFVDATISDTIELRSPEYITDETIVSMNILGRTGDGTEAGKWLTTAAEVSKDLLAEIGITTVNDQSFLDGSALSTQLISMAIPFDFNSKSLPTVKKITDALNVSVRGSLTLDNDLLIKYQPVNAFTGEDLPVIRDNDVINWSVKTTNGKTYQRTLVKYRHTDVDLATLEPGNLLVDFNSQFVERYIGTTKVDEIDVYLYEDRDANIAAHRNIYFNQLSVSTLKIDTDLRLENVEIGSVVIADFRRLYRRKGDNVRKKVMLVIGKTVTGERTQLELSDLGNTFNTSSYITPNDAPDWTTASQDEKLIYGYITDNQGIVNNEEDTAGTHLIS